MKPKTKPARVKVTKAWAWVDDDGDIPELPSENGTPLLEIYGPGNCDSDRDTPVVILDARDHAAAQRELRRLRKENSDLKRHNAALSESKDIWLRAWIRRLDPEKRQKANRLLETIRKGRAR